MKAKTSSLIGMIIGAICLLVEFVIVLLKFVKTPDFTITLEQTVCLIVMGVAPSIPFCPIYLSIVLDKIQEIKNGTKSKSSNVLFTDEELNNEINDSIEKEILQ